jgi:two-component system nitrogen regulation sensor histidine kinase GlnL
MVAVTRPDGTLLFVNAAFEAFTGLSRRSLLRRSLFESFTDAATLRETLIAVSRNEIATGRLEATLRLPLGAGVLAPATAAPSDGVAVQVIATQVDTKGSPGGSDRVLVELIEVQQQARQEREARTFDQAQANKELIRNLAHEIKNPLGGIRGAAQLLALELPGLAPGRATDDGFTTQEAGAPPGDPRGVNGRDLTEYTQVIIHEADRLQALVDRLLAPHRRPHLVADVNIHEVCERVRSLIQAEFPRGLSVERDYDVSIPDFRGDREQLIQALLNIAHNAAHALRDRIGAGDARIMLRTRVKRQVTIGKQRWRLALELHVEDNGPGVPEDIRDRIFMPLVSGREGGSGLGLTLAQTFVQQHQGTIECTSTSGRTDFCIVIPLP